MPRLLAGLLIAVCTITVAAGGVDAHTDVGYTIPAADETVAEPVTTITVAFDDPVTVVGAGFEVFTPDEQRIRPQVFTADDMVFVLTVPEPLAGGVVGVRYEVTAADGHLLEDAYTFTVTGTAVAPATTTLAPATVPAVPADDVTDATGTGDGGGSSTGIIVGVVAAVVLGAVALLLLRSRLGRSAPA